MPTKAKIISYDSLFSLHVSFPWTKEVIKLPDLPGLVVYSESRDETDLVKCAHEIKQILKNTSATATYHDEAVLISAKTVWPDSKISSRYFGHYKSITDDQKLGATIWVSHGICNIDRRTISYLIAKYCPLDLETALDFVIQNPAGILFGNASQESVNQWFEQEKSLLWNRDSPHGEIKLNLDRIASTFPQAPHSGLAAYGSEDFGGIYCFCFGSRFNLYSCGISTSSSCRR